MITFVTMSQSEFDLFIPFFIRVVNEMIADVREIAVVRQSPSILIGRITEEDYPDINKGCLELRAYFGDAGKYFGFYSNPKNRTVTFGTTARNFEIIKKIQDLMEN